MWGLILFSAVFANVSTGHDRSEAASALLMMSFFSLLVLIKMTRITLEAMTRRNSATVVWFLGINSALTMFIMVSGLTLLYGTVTNSPHMPLYFSLSRAAVTSALVASLVISTAEVERETWQQIFGKIAKGLAIASAVYYSFHFLFHVI